MAEKKDRKANGKVYPGTFTGEQPEGDDQFKNPYSINPYVEMREEYPTH